MIRNFAADRRGTVITIFALSAMVLAVMVAIVMNQISFYFAKRNLQAAVDMATLMVMQSGNLTVANAQVLIETQLGQKVTEVTVVKGSYTADASVAEANRFKPNGSPQNAVQIGAKIPATKVMMGGMLAENQQIAATARAARRTSASIVVGSRLVRIQGGLSAALLDAALGYKGKLTVMDYESLASANVDVGGFLKALNVSANIKAVTFDDVLQANVTVKQVLDAVIATTTDGKVLALLKKGAPVSGTGKVQMSKVIDLGSMTKLPIDGLLAGQAFPVSVGEVLNASAALSDGDHQIALNLAAVLGDASIANASLYVGEKPQVLNYAGRAGSNTKVDTSQFKLTIGALGLSPLTAVAVDVSLADAEVEIDSIKCKADGTPEVVLKAKTDVATVGVKASLLPRIPVKLGNNESKQLTFTNADIKAQTYKPVRSGLGLQLGGLSVAQKLLFNPVDVLLEKLGLHIAEADVKVIDATCGDVGLVH